MDPVDPAILRASDATDQARLIQQGDVTAEALVLASIERILALDPQLNAMVSTRFEHAVREARAVYAGAAFSGVPTVVKDLGCGIAGEPLWCGNRVLKRTGHRATSDGIITAALRNAGLVLLGRTNTAEFGATITTEPTATGSCANPWQPAMTAGGSSGGSAAAVAAGYVALAHGTDASGSVRIPAAMCGVVGFKPTNGSLPLDSNDGDGWFGLSTPGLLARSVRDVRSLFDSMRQFSSRSTTGAAAQRPTSSLSIAATRPISDPDTAAVFDRVCSVLREQGHRVELEQPSFMDETRWRRTFVTLAGVGLHRDVQRWGRTVGSDITPDDLDPSTSALAELGRLTPVADADRAIEDLADFRAEVASWWAGPGTADLILSPVLESPQAPTGWLSDPTDGARRIRATMRYTPQFNMSGDPALALPLGTTATNLPIGLQLVAPRGRETTLFTVAEQLESVLPWSDRSPDI